MFLSVTFTVSVEECIVNKSPLPIGCRFNCHPKCVFKMYLKTISLV